MGIFTGIRNLFGSSETEQNLTQQPQPADRADDVLESWPHQESLIPENAQHIRRWSAGQTTLQNARYFARNSAGPSAINRDAVNRLDNLINNCRNEISRSPWLQGTIDIDTTMLVGEHGPRIDIVCDAPGGDTWAEAVEQEINDWAESCDIAGKRALVDFLCEIGRGWWSDGGALFEKRTARRSDGPITLRLAAHDILYLASPPDKIQDPSTVMGVEVDSNGAPVRYHIGEVVHYTNQYVPWLNTSPRPADLVFHVVDPLKMEPSQLRGVPYTGTVLEPSAQMRLLDKSVLDALEMAARFNIALTTKEPKLTARTKLFKDVINFAKNGAATAIPPGYEASGIKSEHPHHKHIEFAEYLLSQLGRPVSLPVTYVLGSFRSANFSSGRMDGGMHSKSLIRRRGIIQRQFVNPLIREAVTELIRARVVGRAPGRWRVNLTWPSALIQPDPLKHYTAQQLAIANGTMTLSQAAAENGHTLESIVRQQERDRQLFERAGLPLPQHLVDNDRLNAMLAAAAQEAGNVN